MILKCNRCNHKGEPEIKMGGLICSKCRIILKYPNSPEFKEMISQNKVEK